MKIEPANQNTDLLLDYCKRLKISHTPKSIEDTIEVYQNLIDAAGESSARAILDHLILTASQNPQGFSWYWVCQELDFEQVVYSVGGGGTAFINHKRMAKESLAVRPADEVDSEILDNYNERISRYSSNPAIYPSYSPS